jgi:hypothetical protein
MKKFLYISAATAICLLYTVYPVTRDEFAPSAKSLSAPGSSLKKISAKPAKTVQPPSRKHMICYAPPVVSHCGGILEEVTIVDEYQVLYDKQTISCSFGTCRCSYSSCIVTQPETASSENVKNIDEEISLDEPKRELTLKLYPNPMHTESRIEIENYSDETYSLELYDLSGKLLRQEVNLSGNVHVLQRNDLPAGIYIWRFVSQDNKVKSGKLIAA